MLVYCVGGHRQARERRAASKGEEERRREPNGTKASQGAQKRSKKLFTDAADLLDGLID
jgi:hypothetical protein